MAALITVTRGADATSCWSKARPASSDMPITRK